MKYKVCINRKKNKYITVEIRYNKCTRNVRSFPFNRTESRRFFLDRHILIKRSLNMIRSQNKHSVALKLQVTQHLFFNKYKQNTENAIANIHEVPKYCSESWGMGAEEFRKAPMIHHKLTTLARTRYTTEENRRKIDHDKEAKNTDYQQYKVVIS